jgi:hypothetical protein
VLGITGDFEVGELAVEALGYAVIAVGCVLCLWGALLLFATWLWPRCLAMPLLGERMTGRFPRTRRNLSLVAGWSLSYGAFLAMTLLESHQLLKVALVAISLVLAVPVFRLVRFGRDA